MSCILMMVAQVTNSKVAWTSCTIKLIIMYFTPVVLWWTIISLAMVMSYSSPVLTWIFTLWKHAHLYHNVPVGLVYEWEIYLSASDFRLYNFKDKWEWWRWRFLLNSPYTFYSHSSTTTNQSIIFSFILFQQYFKFSFLFMKSNPPYSSESTCHNIHIS